MALRAVPEHPKFAELKAVLGKSRYTILGCLEAMWHFTGRFTPQGDIGKYSDTAIESWLEWDGEPGGLIAAFIKSKWIDTDSVHRLLVHDWHIHADKATKNALWRAKLPFCTPGVRTPTEHVHTVEHESSTASRLPEPVPVPVPEPEDIGLSSSSPSASALIRPEDFANAWNERRGPLPKVDKFTEGRRRKVRARIRDGLTLDRFLEAVENCRAKPFLSGVNDRGWVATFDWLVANAENTEKAISNPYGLSTGGIGNGANKQSATKQRVDANVAAIDKALARRGVERVGHAGRADGAAISAPEPDGYAGGLPGGLRSAGGEVLAPVRERSSPKPANTS